MDLNKIEVLGNWVIVDTCMNSGEGTIVAIPKWPDDYLKIGDKIVFRNKGLVGLGKPNFYAVERNGIICKEL